MIEPGLELLANRRCPDCGRTHFLRGPGSGEAIGIECAACGQRFIVLAVDDNLVAAERIAYCGYWPELGDWP